MLYSSKLIKHVKRKKKKKKNPELVKTSFAFLGIQINKVKKQEYRVLLESYTKPKTQLELYSNIYP
jgi:hypothetical protein